MRRDFTAGVKQQGNNRKTDGYFSSLYRGLAGKASTYTNFIIVFVCLSGSLFVKPEKESRVLYALTIINGILFVIWAIAMVAEVLL